ncbi:MAG: ABC transporter ATP-binding protein [Proteobacteria bacterium]|nr:ABC transporter ATP-binding protein [Pseudomonadota bacterium]MBU4419416.1 ABC transporter ATP-binding protein [Pseudomonadota bacterium]
MVNSDSVSDHLIAARDICKSFNNTGGARIEIIMDLNFNLDIGETIAVIGASGIGKSTLLHILGTLDRPDSGNLFFKGDDVFLFNNDKLARFRNEFVGFVFQFHHLLPEFSAIENAMMPALIKGLSKDTSREAAEEILVRVGLRDRLFHRVGKLSGGEQQRVALARALILRPAILLADEPTGNLDKKNSGQVHELLLELNQELRMALVVVTHNLELASYMSQSLTIIDGKLVKTR